MKQIDKRRANYYFANTGKRWKDPASTICIPGQFRNRNRQLCRHPGGSYEGTDSRLKIENKRLSPRGYRTEALGSVWGYAGRENDIIKVMNFMNKKS